LVELKKGETSNGHLVNCVAWMNIHLGLGLIFFYTNILHLFSNPKFPIPFHAFILCSWPWLFLQVASFFFFALKNMVTISTVLDALNFFFLLLTAASKFLTQDCSRPLNGKKEMSLFSCRVVSPYESRIFYKFVNVVLRPFSFFFMQVLNHGGCML